MRPLCLLLVAVLGAAASPAVGQTPRPVTIETVLGQESLGQVRIGPGGRWIVFERRAAWSAAASYRFGLMTTQLLSSLEIHDTWSDGPPRVLSDRGHATGYVSGPFSPDGERMLVYRLTETSWRLGVLTLATGETRWFTLTPEYSGLGRTVAWRSPTEVIVIARAPDDLPLVFRLGGQTQARKAALWRRFEAGHAPSAVSIPSGVRRGDRDSAAPARLVRLDLGTGAQTELAVGALFDLELSPDGATVAVLADAEDLQASGDAPVHVGTPARRRRLLVVDVVERRVDEPLPGQDFLSHLLSWSPDGRSVLAFGRSPGGSWDDGRFWRVPRAGPARPVPLGDARPWVGEQADGMPFVRAGWDGGTPVVQVRTTEDAPAWRRAGPNPLIIPVREPSERLFQAGGHAWIERGDGLYRLNASSDAPGLPGRLQSPERAAGGGGRARTNPADVRLAPDILLQAGCLARLGASRSGACLPPLGPGETLVAASPDARFAVVQGVSATGSTRLLRRDPSGDHPLAALNLPLDRLAWGRIEAVTHPGPGGQALTSWLLLPPSDPGDGPAPLAVILYPGAAYAAAPSWLRPGGERRHINPAVLAAHGYAVLVPSLPHPIGGAAGLDDLAGRIDAIIDQAARQAPIDPARVALIGHSYGGHAALLTAARSDRFRAVVASAGYADLSRVYALTPHFLVSPDDGVPINALAGWAESGQGAIGVSLPARPSAYVDNSPVYLADRIRTPVLLIEGDLDPAGGDVLFGALYRLGREADLVTYAGEGHVFVSPANLRDLHARILAWLDRYLGPVNVCDPPLPVLRPDLEDGADEQPVVARPDDQPVLRQVPLQGLAVQQPLIDLKTVEQQWPQGHEAGAGDMAVEAAEIALVAALDQHQRQAVGEGLTRQTAIAHARDQPVGRDGEAMLDHRLAQQGMEQIPGAGAQAVAPEQLGVDELAQLSGLGGRQILYVLEPRMPPPGRGPGSGGAQPQGASQYSPGRMPRPAPDRREKGRRQAGQSLAPESVGRHRRIGRLEEDRVPALPGQQGRGAAPAHARRDLAVIGDVHALERRPHAFAQGAQLAQGDGLDRLADRGEVERQPVGDRLGPRPLVTFAPVPMEVKEPRLTGPTGRGQTARDNG